MLEADAQSIASALFKAVQHIHNLDVIHSDIKPENILVVSVPLRESSIKLTDFGLARLISEPAIPGDRRGTWLYWAPEVWEGGPRGKPADIWACGIVLYACLTGHLPYPTDSQLAQEAALAGLPNLASDLAGIGVSEEAMRFLQAVLNSDRMHRPTAAEALRADWLSPPCDPSGVKQERMRAATVLEMHVLWRPTERQALHWLHPGAQTGLGA
jgi:serine/threonine protein kinase